MSKSKSLNNSFKEYWSNYVWKKQHLLNKLLMFTIATIIVIPVCLAFFFWLKDQSGSPYGENGFIYIDITWNYGAAFGNLKNNIVVIYLIQSLVSVVIFIATIFVYQKSFLVWLYIIFLGGLFNLLQRAFSPDNTVLDYLHFGFWKNFAIFNMPDAMIVVSSLGLMINILVSFLLPKNKNEKNKK